jgi:hypothetical protein
MGESIGEDIGLEISEQPRLRQWNEQVEIPSTVSVTAGRAQFSVGRRCKWNAYENCR